jgi:predicted GH43/DUF377 family glycosyl hydrolase
MAERVAVEKLGIVIEPTQNVFEKKAVLNPACYKEGDTVHMLYRAIDDDLKSSIGYARLKGPKEVVDRTTQPLLTREYAYESMGLEDPRIVKIDDLYYVTYVAHDGKNAVTCYAVSSDLEHFEKGGIISPQMTYHEVGNILREEGLKDEYSMYEAYYEEFGGKDILLWEKDTFLFPRKIDGKFVLMHRILPDIQLIYFEKFSDLKNRDFWIENLKNLAKSGVVLENRYGFETRHIGGGAPPIETADGWVFIFHSTRELNAGRTYYASAALLDCNDPTKVIGRLDTPLFAPTESWEKSGFVNNVVFPTGTAVFGDDLYIYYGAADRIVAVAKVKLSELVAELKREKES